MNPTLITGNSAFGALDWAVLAGYFIVLIITGVVVSRRPKDAREYFVGERSMPVWAVAISVLATGLSAATFIGAPEDAYKGNLTYVSANLGALIAVAIVAGVFIPAFYRHNVVTIYELLGLRFGPGAKIAASWAFLVGRVFASGARLYIAAIPAALILFGDKEVPHLLIAIAAIAAVGVVYTLAGGIASIIWTDVVQTTVFLAATIGALIVLIGRIPASGGAIVDALAATKVGDGSKLTALSLSLDPGQAFTLLTAVTGWTLFNLAAYGTDQDLAQRMLTCSSAVKGGRSAFAAILAGIPVTLLFLTIGALLYVFYDRPDLMGASAPDYRPKDSRDVFLAFILREMPAGMSGLMLAGLFAVAFSSLLSALNAMASAFVNDCWRLLRPGRDERHYLRVSRLAVACWGAVLAAFAAGCIFWQSANGETLIQFALGVMGFAYAGLLAVFLTALFTRRGSAASAIAALVVGFAVVLALQPWAWSAWAPEAWQAVKLASPWRLLAGTAVAFAVCCAGKPKPAIAEATP